MIRIVMVTRLFALIVLGFAIGYYSTKFGEPIAPCQSDSDFGRAWYGQRCVPYCPPDPRECD